MIQEGLYCRFCYCFADLEEIKKAGGSAEIQLVNKPFKKFARLSNYLDPHQKTAHHKKSLEKAQAFLDSVKNPNRNIDVKLDRAVAKEMEKNRTFLAPIVSIIVFTARLGLPFRGHRDEGVPLVPTNSEQIDVRSGNFKALLQFRAASGDQVLAQHLETCRRNASYISYQSQNL